MGRNIANVHLLNERGASRKALEHALRLKCEADPEDYIVLTCNGTVEAYSEVVEGDTVLVLPEERGDN